MSETDKPSVNTTAWLKSTVVNVVQVDEPSPSTSGDVQSARSVSIHIPQVHTGSEKSVDTNSSETFSIFETKRGLVGDEESYATIESCLKEKTTNTMLTSTVFSRNQNTQRIIMTNNEAPPPYESQPPPVYPAYSNVPRPVYQVTGGSGAAPTPNPTPIRYYSSSLITFQEVTIRHKFVQKVCAILAVQFSITMGFILLVMFYRPVRKFVRGNFLLLIMASCLMLVLYFMLVCYKSVRRIFPLNFILLSLFTVGMSYLCAAVTARYDTKVVLIAVAGTALICLVVSLLSCQTWFDITKWSFIIALAGIVVVIFGLVVMIVTIITYSPILWLVYSGIIVAMFSVFLLYDLQCILGGRREEMSPEEYIYGALTIYVDVVMIFMYMLQLIRACS